MCKKMYENTWLHGCLESFSCDLVSTRHSVQEEIVVHVNFHSIDVISWKNVYCFTHVHMYMYNMYRSNLLLFLLSVLVPS